MLASDKFQSGMSFMNVLDVHIEIYFKMNSRRKE